MTWHGKKIASVSLPHAQITLADDTEGCTHPGKNTAKKQRFRLKHITFNTRAEKLQRRNDIMKSKCIFMHVRQFSATALDQSRGRAGELLQTPSCFALRLVGKQASRTIALDHKRFAINRPMTWIRLLSFPNDRVPTYATVGSV